MKPIRSQRITISLWVVCLLSLLVTVSVRAKDSQPPIIALYGNKLYAVSAEDGSAQVLAEAPEDQTFFMERFASMSPDGKQMVYATATDPESQGGLVVTLFLLNLETGESAVFKPSGGVLDRQAHEGYYFRVDYPTWSVDGSRLYYVRSAVDNVGYGKMDEIQLAYWDVKTQKHKLVARLDPKQQVFDLSAVTSGIIVHLAYRLGDARPVVLYGLDGSVLNENTIENLYPDPVEYKGRDYYATGSPHGGIATLIDVETGKQEPIDGGYYPAARSHLAGEQSMHIFRFIGRTGGWYSVYGADYRDYVDEIGEMSGLHYAFSPDGQLLAFTQYDNGSSWAMPIQVMHPDGTVRTLPFKAEQIYWGASEQVAFYAPG
jgi:Tol biopolymer transport system component